MDKIDIFDINAKKNNVFIDIFTNNDDLLIFNQMYNIDPLKIIFFENQDSPTNSEEISIYNNLYNYQHSQNEKLIKEIYIPTQEETIQLQLYKQNFIINGWFSLDYYSKKMISQRGNLVPCYICMNYGNQEEIMFCRIINKNIIKPHSETMDNLFVICNSCFISNTCVKAPKTFEDIQEHLVRLSSRYYDMKSKVFFINQEIKKMGIHIDYHQTILNNNKLTLNTIIEENDELVNNIQIEQQKHTEFKAIKSENKKNFKNIRQQYQTVTEYINKMVNNTTNSFINMNSIVLNSRNIIQNKLNINLNSIESIAETKEKPNFNCKICYNNRLDYALYPCGHTLCKDCSESISSHQHQNINSCPFCKQHIDSYHKIFLS